MVGDGGGVLVGSSENLTLKDSTITGNSAAASGGGIYGGDLSSVTVMASEISGNSAGRSGGGISGGYVTVTSSTISGNSSDFTGGGVSGDVVTVKDSTVSRNATSSSCGGIHAGRDVTATDSTVTGNTASFSGGGICASYGSVTVKSSTISGNSSGGNGGGIAAAFFGGNVTVTSSTISGNSASGDGGGIYNRGDTLLENSIVATNIATDFGHGAASIVATNSLIGDNTGTSLPEAPIGIPDEDGNLIGDPNGVGVIDPLLGPLADNGGPTKTHLPQLGSPAIEAGDPDFASPLEFDQRGAPFTRVFNGQIDMGAVERQFVVDTLIDESDGDFSPGDLSLREALENATVAAHFTFDTSLDGGTITLTQGELAITDSLTVDATSLDAGITIDASGNDPTPDDDNGDGSRIFNVNDGDNSRDSDVALSGLTLTGGDTGESGGAVDTRESLTASDSTITGNSAGGGGGGIVGGNVTVTSSTISGNSAGAHGGGIYINDPAGKLTVTLSTISGNTAGGDGGGISAKYDTTVTSSTISDNSSLVPVQFLFRELEMGVKFPKICGRGFRVNTIG